MRYVPRKRDPSHLQQEWDGIQGCAGIRLEPSSREASVRASFQSDLAGETVRGVRVRGSTAPAVRPLSSTS